MKRDLMKDLELCNEATPGPWVICDWDTDVCGGIITPDTQEVVIEAEDWDMPVKVKREDADFIVQAREGWPHAIERAIKAESLARELVGVIDDLCRQINQFTFRCGLDKQMWEVYRTAKEVLSDE